MLEERPGPVHIEIPTNVLNYEYQKLKKNNLCIKKKKIKSSEKKNK